MKLLKKDFKKWMFSLEIDGFKWGDDIQSFVLKKESENRIEEIIFGYKTTASGYILRKPIISIYFLEVENCLKEFYEKYELENTYGKGTINTLPEDIEKVDLEKLEIEISNEYSFNQVKSELLNIAQIIASDFFSKYDSLQNVLDTTEKMAIEKMANFIVQPLPQRRMVIKKVCNDSGYKEYADMVLNFYKSEKDETWKEIEKLIKFLG